MLKPYERSMRNYSSAKLELLALKWAVCEKFKDYLIGSRFTILTDNNPLTYVRTSCLGAAQICCSLTWHCLTLRSNTGLGNQIRQLTLSVGILLILIPLLSLWMMMKSGKPYPMVWFARLLIIIWNLLNCPIISDMKLKPMLQRSMWLIVL